MQWYIFDFSFSPGELGDRKAQSQVFSNLAYAYTETEQYPDANTAFSHAIQAAKDSGDREAQCLATEGLAAVQFRQRKYKRAISSYKEALRLIGQAPEPDEGHANRIVDKLSDAIQYELKCEEDVVEKPPTSANKLRSRPASNKSLKGKPRLPKDSRNTLIAKGLEDEDEGSGVEDSSAHDSDESTETWGSENIVQVDGQQQLSPPQSAQPPYTVKHSKVTKKDDTDTVKDYDDDIPRADKEYFLAEVAQQQANEVSDDSPRKPHSRMCVIMWCREGKGAH